MSDADFRLALARLRAARTHLVTACEMVPARGTAQLWRQFVLADIANIERLIAEMRRDANRALARRRKARR